MTTERRSYADPCGVSRALDAVGERWALLIVRELMLGPRRFGQLRDGLPGVSPNVLTQRLRELGDDGLVRRYTPEPPANVPVYELTERGRGLGPVLIELGRWGSAQPGVAGRELGPASMLIALETMFDPASVPVPVTYGLRLAGEDYRVALRPGGIEITRGRAADADAVLATDVATLRSVAFGRSSPHAAERAGTLTVTGDRRAAARFPKHFRKPPLPADGG